jgi:hypothetical protein
MGWGTLFQVTDTARTLIAQCGSKGEWYGALDQLRVEEAPKCDAEDSIRFWGLALEGQPYPLSKLFLGDIHADLDGASDPNVSFFGQATVRDVSQALDSNGRGFFEGLFTGKDHVDAGQIRFLEPLRDFFKDASAKGLAVIALWEC